MPVRIGELLLKEKKINADQLQQALNNQKANGGKRKRSVADYEAVGMWKDRQDIGTGVEYENRMRKYRK